MSTSDRVRRCHEGVPALLAVCSDNRNSRGETPRRARNALAKAASAEWIHFHHVDDEIAPDYLTQVLPLCTGETDQVYHWIDFIDDTDVSKALIEAVVEWGKARGMTGIHGPLGFSDMDNEGMLIKGFEELATMASIYNYPYYPVHMEKLGFTRAADWLQIEIKVPPVPEKFERAAELIARKYNLRVLKAKKAKDFLPYAQKMWDTLNEAFDNLYGYTRLTKRQTDLYTKQYFPFINPDYVSMVLNEAD